MAGLIYGDIVIFIFTITSENGTNQQEYTITIAEFNLVLNSMLRALDKNSFVSNPLSIILQANFHAECV